MDLRPEVIFISPTANKLAMWEALLTASFDNPAVQAIAIGVVRDIVGYIENAAEKEQEFNFRALIGTIFRVFPQAMGLAAFGIPAVGAFFTDWAIVKLAKIGRK